MNPLPVAAVSLAMTTSRNRQRRGALALVIGLVLLGVLVVQSGSAAGRATATASAVKKVDINDFAFHPATIRVKRGGKVAWTNSSNVTHTATRAGSFDTKQIKPGTTKTVTFARRGTFVYHCSIHSFMKGKVVVE